MEYLEKPEVVVLKGKEAIETLNNYICELKQGSAEELTEEQAKAMIKIANGLIQSIRNGSCGQDGAGKAFLPKLRETAKKLISGEPAHEFLHSQVGSPVGVYHQPTNSRQIT